MVQEVNFQKSLKVKSYIMISQKWKSYSPLGFDMTATLAFNELNYGTTLLRKEELVHFCLIFSFYAP